MHHQHLSSLRDWLKPSTYLDPDRTLTFLVLRASQKPHPFSRLPVSASVPVIPHKKCSISPLLLFSKLRVSCLCDRYHSTTTGIICLIFHSPILISHLQARLTFSLMWRHLLPCSSTASGLACLGHPVAFAWMGADWKHSPPQYREYCHYLPYASVITGDDFLRKFWELEENPSFKSSLSPEEHAALRHFEDQHYRTESGRFVVPLPKRPDAKLLGESRSQAVRRFVHVEHSLHAKGIFQEFKCIIDEYLEPKLMWRDHRTVFYLPMHVMTKESSITTKVQAVFNASAKISTGESLNDTLMVGPTVHSSLVDVLLRFRFHQVALVADESYVPCYCSHRNR